MNGNSSELECNIFPPIDVDEDTQICMLSLQTANSIPNIDVGCNQIAIVKKDREKLIGDYILQSKTNEDVELCLLGNKAANSDMSVNTECNRTDVEKNINQLIVQKYTLPTGSYELEKIEAVIKHILPKSVTKFELRANTTTLKCEMLCSENIDFSVPDSIAKLLGFKNIVYESNTVHESENIINIMKVNCIKIECNLISGSFTDGDSSQTIHEFYHSVPVGFKIIEVPKHLVFYPLNTSSISNVKISIRDQEGSLINLRGETITVRLQIKSNYGAQV